jgi:hypothetical protein
MYCNMCINVPSWPSSSAWREAHERRGEGEGVWEYVNPYFGARQRLQINSVQRAYRYTAAEVARAQEAT